MGPLESSGHRGASLIDVVSTMYRFVGQEIIHSLLAFAGLTPRLHVVAQGQKSGWPSLPRPSSATEQGREVPPRTSRQGLSYCGCSCFPGPRDLGLTQQSPYTHTHVQSSWPCCSIPWPGTGSRFSEFQLGLESLCCSLLGRGSHALLLNEPPLREKNLAAQ